jgi:hypothetical protein
MVASLQCRCHLETATIKHRIERNDDQIEPFFDSIGQKLTLRAPPANVGYGSMLSKKDFARPTA